ncbi:MAG TPA: thiol-activated cytolysin family protein [Kofleriaceae bacterium]|nr:thiol-activated cytolysin family protein [Kofleriaceae bacterium]
MSSPRALAFLLWPAALCAGCLPVDGDPGRGAAAQSRDLCPFGDDSCPTGFCGDGVCTDDETCDSCSLDCGPCFDPDIINVPGTPQLITMDQLRDQARALGVSPLLAGVPNIEQFLQRPVFFAYPTDGTSTSDFMLKLFRSGNWSTLPPGQATTPTGDDGTCRTEQVDATYQPDDFVTFAVGDGLLFPSALLQGKYVSTGGDTVVPLHVPYTSRNPVYLLSTFYDGGFSNAAVAPTSTATDVYAAISQMIQTANAQGTIGIGKVTVDIKLASSFEEAMTKFGFDAKLFGASVSGSFSSSHTTQSNSVFVKYQQSLFSISQDLQGFTPTQAELGAGVTVADLENLGAAGELGYDNLPAYIRNVVYGRVLIFSLTSTTSESELDAAVHAVYGTSSGSATTAQRAIVQNSEIHMFAFGGPSAPVQAVIKSGNPMSYFSLENVPRSTLLPIGYEVRRFDDLVAAMSRTTSYTRRICNGPKEIDVELSDTYKNGTIYVKAAGGQERILGRTSNGFVNVNATPYLAGGNDKIKINVQVGSTDVFNPSHGHTKIDFFYDGAHVMDSPRWSCNRCNSQDVRAFLVDKFSGQVTEIPLNQY